MSGIDPVVQQTNESKVILRKLPSYLNVKFTEDELNQLSIRELPPATVGGKIVNGNLVDAEYVQPDVWWATVFKTNDFPHLQCVLTKALSLITGPVVEGTFSEVQNIVTSSRNKIRDKTVSALLTVSYDMRADGQPLCERFPVRVDVKVDTNFVKAVGGSWKVSLNKHDDSDDETQNHHGDIILNNENLLMHKTNIISFSLENKKNCCKFYKPGPKYKGKNHNNTCCTFPNCQKGELRAKNVKEFVEGIQLPYT